MPYEKLKDENYKNLGGINVKASTYLTGPQQFLDLRNYTFERTGALQSRPGIVDSFTLAKSIYGATPTSLYQWNSANYIKNQGGAGQSSTSGASFVVFDSGANLYGLNSQTLINIGSSLSNGPFDFAQETTQDYTGNLKDFLYFANGQNFRVYSSGNPTLGTWPYTLSIGYNFPPSATIYSFSLTTAYFGGSLTPWPSGTHTVQVLLGKRFVPTNSVADYWFFSEPSPPAYGFIGFTVNSPNNFSWEIFFDVPQASNYDFAIVKYTSPLGGVAYFSDPRQVAEGLPDFPNFPAFSIGAGLTGSLAFKQFSSAVNVSGISNFTLIPKYLESYKNMLFAAGFSSNPHRLTHSNIGQFLFTPPENIIDVQPGQSREITNLTKFQDTLIVFKDASIYELNGDSPETLSVKTVTTEYGCVNNRASVTFKNKLWFVDKKGICEYNGPDTFIVSYPVETYFNELDPDIFRALHVKSANQVWFASGDTVLVYDYDVNAWTIYDKIPINSTAGSEIIEYGQSLPQPSWITSSTSFFFVSRLDQDATTDRGAGITLIKKTRYHKRMGDSTQEMFRRVFMDIEPGPTMTPTMTINMLPDYGNSIADTRYVNVGPYQSRVDFGVSAKSLSIQTILQASEKITVNGYTIESRYLRST